jgi:hypothetical protein
MKEATAFLQHLPQFSIQNYDSIPLIALFSELGSLPTFYLIQISFILAKVFSVFLFYM